MLRRWAGRDHSAGTIASAESVHPVVLAVRSRGRAFRRRLDSVPAPRAGRGSMLALGFIFAGWVYGSVMAGTACKNKSKRQH